MRSQIKLGPDWLSRFDVYWTQTDRQTDKQSIYLNEKDVRHFITELAEVTGVARGKKQICEF